MSTDILGSNEPAKNGYGQNGDKTPSSITGSKPNIPNVSPPSAVVPGLDERDTIGERTSGHEPLKTSPRGPADGSPGGTVPSNARPVTQPAATGAHKL